MTQAPRTPTSTLVRALELIARNKHSESWTVEAVMLEAAQRLKELHKALENSHSLNVNWSSLAEPDMLEHLSEYRRVLRESKEVLGDDPS